MCLVTVYLVILLGTFRAYVRAGNALTYTIQPSKMQGISVSINYVSRVGRIETMTIGLSLQVPISNAQARESLPALNNVPVVTILKIVRLTVKIILFPYSCIVQLLNLVRSIRR
jgi:hypothetical protein